MEFFKNRLACVMGILLPLAFVLAATAAPVAPSRTSITFHVFPAATSQSACDHPIRLAPTNVYDATTQYDSAGGFSLAAKSEGGRISEATDQEHAIDQLLKGEGRDVKPNPLHGKAGAGRQADRLVDGVKAEYKSLGSGATSSRIRNVVNDSIRDGGQARSIIIDARGSGLTKEQAIQGIRRAMGISRGRIDHIRIIGDGWDVTN